jgi:hypothetical protein
MQLVGRRKNDLKRRVLTTEETCGQRLTDRLNGPDVHHSHEEKRVLLPAPVVVFQKKDVSYKETTGVRVQM